jgi:Flp pilus assembly protein TadG
MTWSRSRRKHSRGQALAELAIIAPVFLTLVGAAVDVSRVYSSWINLEAAARDAAQYVASDPGYTTSGGYYDSTDTPNYCAAYPCTAAPSTDAKTVVDAALGRSFTKASDQSTCTSPKVWASLSSPSSSSSDGGSAAYPMAQAQVTACLPFHTLFAYPFFTQGGDWIIRVDKTFKILVGR